MHEDDTDRRFAACSGLYWGRAGLGILRNIGVELLQIVVSLVFTHDLDQRGERRIGGAGRVRIGDLDFALEGRVEKICPALRLLEALGLENLGIVAPTERAGIDTDRLVAGTFGLLLGPILQLVKHGRLVFLRQVLGCRLQMRVAGPGPPDIGLRVACFCANLGIGLAG